ncbi:SET domain containing protein, putative [Babesia bigemina]|uniref:SET domain containing protein, putative n=1 Tax=Babesia bigemina TaxID=5866 RepID=A0A061DD22_BABBI|nr:SET domain containing protein, putative [Babesia bigemina]CDR95880.1 SET domain containing protein, putative [Babesia bigemina]|eukprot:XP_012768066.1 SET domain containing protein, putative [Babesia bigemina]
MVSSPRFPHSRCSVISGIFSDSKESTNDDYDFGRGSPSSGRSQSSVNCTPYLIPPSSCTVDRSGPQTRSETDSCEKLFFSPGEIGSFPVTDELPDKAMDDEGADMEFSTPTVMMKAERGEEGDQLYGNTDGVNEEKLDSATDNDVVTRTPVLTRQSSAKMRNAKAEDTSEVDQPMGISSFVKAALYGQRGEKFRLFWLPNYEVSSLMRVPSIAQLSDTRRDSAERLYMVYTAGGMDILQDVSDIAGVERRPFETPFVVLYSYSFKSMYFKVVGKMVESCSTVTFENDGDSTKIVNEEDDDDEVEVTSRSKSKGAAPTAGYAFYRSCLYGLDDRKKPMRIKVSVRSIKDSELDLRAASASNEEASHYRAALNSRVAENDSESKNSLQSALLESLSRNDMRSSKDLASSRSLDSIQFDGGVPSSAEGSNKQVVKGKRRGTWVYATTIDHDEGGDEMVHGLPAVLLAELRWLLRLEDTSTLSQCNVSMVNPRIEAMIKQNFELYDRDEQQLTSNVKRDLVEVTTKEPDSLAMYNIGDHVVSEGDILTVRFRTLYRGYSEEDTMKVYSKKAIELFFETLSSLNLDGVTDLTMDIAQFCPNVFWNLALTGDFEGSLKRMVPNMVGNTRKRRRNAAKADSPVITSNRILPVAKSNYSPVFDNNFVIMQNLLERDAQKKIAHLDKIREQQRDLNGMLLRNTVSKYLDADELISTVMDADGFMLKSMQGLTAAQRNVVYKTYLKRGLFAPVRLDYIPAKGRAVFAAYDITKGDFVVEYKGQIITEKVAKIRDQKYDKSRSYKGSFVFYFRIHTKRYCIDATEEDITFGPARLINHSRRNPNVVPKALEIDGCPRLFFVAKRDIKSGEELLIDYGERDPSVIKDNPWLMD